MDECGVIAIKCRVWNVLPKLFEYFPTCTHHLPSSCMESSVCVSGLRQTFKVPVEWESLDFIVFGRRQEFGFRYAFHTHHITYNSYVHIIQADLLRTPPASPSVHNGWGLICILSPSTFTPFVEKAKLEEQLIKSLLFWSKLQCVCDDTNTLLVQVYYYADGVKDMKWWENGAYFPHVKVS